MEETDHISRPHPVVAGEQSTPQPAGMPDGSPLVPTLPIKALTRAMSVGNEIAFREFYDAYFNRLFRYLLVVTNGNEESAREALQLTLVRVVRHVKEMDAEEKFWSWLTVLARSALTDESRKQRRYFAFLQKFTGHVENETDAIRDGETDERLRTLLDRKLALLPDDERRLMEQKYLLHLPVRAIAEEQLTSEKAVESKLSRVRKKLRDAVLAELKNESSSSKS